MIAKNPEVHAGVRVGAASGGASCVRVSRAWLCFEWLVPKGTDPDPRGIAPTVRFSVPFLLDRSHRRSDGLVTMFGHHRESFLHGC